MASDKNASEEPSTSPNFKKIFNTAWRFAFGFLAALGFAALITLITTIVTYSKVINYVPPPLPDRMVLTFTVDHALVETVDAPSLSRPLLRPPTTLHEIVRALDLAREDKRVEGVVVRIAPMMLSIAQIQELRDAVRRFRESGKFSVAFAEDFGGFSPGLGAYYLAAAFEDIWLQPVGLVSITGLNLDVPFLRGTLDKVGIEPLIDQRGEYKSTPETFTRSAMSPENRRMMVSLIDDLAAQMVSDIARDRELSAATVKTLIDQAPITHTNAVELGVVDMLGYWDASLDAAKLRAGGKEGEDEVKLINLAGYLFQTETERAEGGMRAFVHNYFDDSSYVEGRVTDHKVALIYGTGTIVSNGGAQVNLGGTQMSAKKMLQVIRDATEDEEIDVILFRIDSPGGSPSASETIRHALLRAKEKGKKIVVSMGSTAASGGYWIASVADKIVAQPATLTGSIGVFGGKVNFSGLWDKLGVSWEGVSFGQNADLWSMNEGYDAQGRKKLDQMLDQIYDDFIARVSEGRGMTVEEADKIARGRVWTGQQAKGIGLVDELGGLDKAIEVSKLMLGLTPKDKVLMVRYPPPKSVLEMLVEIAMEGVDMGPAAPQTSKLRDLLGAFLLPPSAHITRMPGVMME